MDPVALDLTQSGEFESHLVHRVYLKKEKKRGGVSDGPILVKIKGFFTVAVFKVEMNYLRPQHDHWGLIVQSLNTTFQDEGRRRNDTHTHTHTFHGWA